MDALITKEMKEFLSILVVKENMNRLKNNKHHHKLDRNINA